MLVTLDGERASVVTGDQNVADDLLVILGLHESSRSLELLVDNGCDDPFDTLSSPGLASVCNASISKRFLSSCRVQSRFLDFG